MANWYGMAPDEWRMARGECLEKCLIFRHPAFAGAIQMMPQGTWWLLLAVAPG